MFKVIFVDVDGRCGAAIAVDAHADFDRHRGTRALQAAQAWNRCSPRGRGRFTVRSSSTSTSTVVAVLRSVSTLLPISIDIDIDVGADFVDVRGDFFDFDVALW
ncbi:hypothetical protein Dvina_29845 [Dactylosporangium vinaceum]|uniref:Uncharacterized protein n=1 Tax=Dactylosporangium vinaceum TaxID=53362 RepID=A0ABV5ME08_9ACTN|nr:hypothetical protein [Dactylosporangium vinaceum]UAB92544.1 hypothetical protein Dvina_29845 [Dactylosporangium vinaceum]